MTLRGPWLHIVASWLIMVAAAGSPGVADPFPTKAVRVITNTAAGSAPDVIARIVTESLTLHWKQQVVIINRPGAGGLIAAQAVVGSEPDGYTLFIPNASNLVVMPETQKLNFDINKAIIPIGGIGTQPFLIAVVPSLGVNTLPELIALAKKRPGEIFYAGSFRGSLPNLTGELFRTRAGIDLPFVPYAGSSQALQDVMTGRVPVVVEALSALAGPLQAGWIKALAVTSLKRPPDMPNTPTVAEVLPGFEANGWFTLMAPAGTPEAIVQQISRDVRLVLDRPDVKERFATLQTYPRPMSPEETAAFIRDQQQLWRPFVKEVGAAPQ